MGDRLNNQPHTRQQDLRALLAHPAEPRQLDAQRLHGALDDAKWDALERAFEDLVLYRQVVGHEAVAALGVLEREVVALDASEDGLHALLYRLSYEFL